MSVYTSRTLPGCSMFAAYPPPPPPPPTVPYNSRAPYGFSRHAPAPLHGSREARLAHELLAFQQSASMPSANVDNQRIAQAPASEGISNADAAGSMAEYPESTDANVHHPVPQPASSNKPRLLSLDQALSPSPPLSEKLDDLSIASPGFAAAREYYRSLDTPPPSSGEMLPNIHSIGLPEPSAGYPRRHSMALDQRLYQQVSKWTLHSTPASRRGSANVTLPSMKTEPGEGEATAALPFASIPAAAAPGQQRILNPLDPRYLGNVPVSYTTAKLREWGDVYLGNATTADAFVRAVAIPRPTTLRARPHSFPPGLQRRPRSVSPRHDAAVPPARVVPDRSPPPAAPRAAHRDLVNVRIVPKAKDRKAFFMTKRFPRHREGRVTKEAAGSGGSHAQTYEQVARAGALAHALNWNEIGNSWRVPPSKALPIHIEYALYRAPLLAAVLLSGHVRKGDTVEVPVPYPEVWPEVIEWVYTARRRDNGKVLENIEYLGGRVAA